ncbi:hypothetical protein ACQCQP_24675 [Ralstonia pseudosolanacearum]|uniref:Uncharacterized protein n=1 Tax=Ralstonia solanacearum TaxID=305 RepID=A0A0S4UAI6_RALSL|nr:MULTISPECIES: hypothetical protein [Ralstonia]NKA56073.1 hypothetical protein [Ralstonia solanacearum]MCK4130098.1 hypothetical protein [Ralstonia pseudosolanacearum]NKA67774.1 hypothetical protein [Ralstonia solanacearum]NKA71059.1 hypothetical protein [Ralstonia solanacearum]NKA85768.1 hypothetical protein [Ralstonia solanacearum]
MNSILLSTGPDPYAHLRQHTAVVPKAAFEGVWATIELHPDPFARQRYTVGIAVAGHDGAFSFRLLDDLAKFECLYGRGDVAEIRSLVDAAEQGLLRAQKNNASLKDVAFDTNAVLLGDLWATSGASLDAVLNRLYFDVIPFIPREERKTRDFVTLDNAAVRRLVGDELKRIAGLAFEQITVEPQRAITDKTTGEIHWLEFNLEPPGRAGNIISAVYKTPSNIELNFLRASRDLSTYARLNKLPDHQLALFVMTPTKDSMSSTELDRIENILGEQGWNLEQQGFVVSAHDSAAPLARDVWEWAAVPA